MKKIILENHSMDERSFFSIGWDLIQIETRLAFSLYVNSSCKETKEHFVRVYKADDYISSEDLQVFRGKYKQLYVEESERHLYVKSLVSGKLSDEVKTDVLKESAIQYLHRIFDEDKEFSTEVLNDAVQGCRYAVEGMVDVLDTYDIDGVRSLISKLSFHDFYTYDHSINVAMYCIALYRAAKPKCSKSELHSAGLGGMLHDLGKIKIPTRILNNPGGLSEQEYEVIKTHPDLGLELLVDVAALDEQQAIDLKSISRVIHEHHENWDGKGYPQGLKAQQIDFKARVCAIADFFDAVTTKRSYSEVLDIDEAIAVMGRCRGTKLDPELFDTFIKHVQSFKQKAKKSYLKLKDNFDPSIPYAKLPLEKVDPEKTSLEKTEKPRDFGGIRVVESTSAKKKSTRKKAS